MTDGLLGAIRRWAARLRGHPGPTTYSKVIACRNCGRAVPIEEATRQQMCQRAECRGDRDQQRQDDSWVDDHLMLK